MGGCYSKGSKRKATSKMPEASVPVRPFYRQNTLEEYECNNNVWIERKETVATKLKINPEQTLEKETVFDKIIPGSEDNVYDFIDEENMDDHSRERALQVVKRLAPLAGRLLPQPPSSPQRLSLAECRRERRNSLETTYSGEIYNGESEDDIADVYEEHTECKRAPEGTLPPLPSALKRILRSNPSPPLPNLNNNTAQKIPAVARSRQRPIAIANGRLSIPPAPPQIRNDPELDNIYQQEVEVTEEETKCLEYTEMVNIFKPMIVQNILVHDILPLLPFLENHDDVYAEMKHHSEKNAVVMLLDELERSKEIGKWHKFIDALKECGYSFIVDNIRGYKFINHHYQKEYLKQMTPVIAKMISPPELMPFLMSYDLLGDTDKEYILCECNNRGDYAGALLLLDRITKRHRNWYKLFIKALDDAKYEDVVVNLRIEKLMDNGRVKDKDGCYETSSNCYEARNQRPRNGAPCIPPRIPISNKRIVQIPSPAIETFEEVYDDSGITKESITGPKPLIEKIDEEGVHGIEQLKTQVKHDNPKFIQLEEEINKLALEERELSMEAELYERKFAHCKNIVEKKKKTRQLQMQIEEMEKEMVALKEAPAIGDESQNGDICEEYDDTEILYTGDTKPHQLMLDIEHDEILEKIKAKLPTFDLDLPVNDSSLFLPLPIFSPKFNKDRIQKLQSDNDSDLSVVLQDSIYEYCENAVNMRM